MSALQKAGTEAVTQQATLDPSLKEVPSLKVTVNLRHSRSTTTLKKGLPSRVSSIKHLIKQHVN